jgi:hypothetical protein
MHSLLVYVATAEALEVLKSASGKPVGEEGGAAAVPDEDLPPGVNRIGDVVFDMAVVDAQVCHILTYINIACYTGHHGCMPLNCHAVPCCMHMAP